MDLSPAQLCGLFAMGFGAWFVSMLAAGGGAITFLPIASLILPARAIAPVITLASALSSVQRCIMYRRQINRRVVLWNLPGLALGSFSGAALLSRLAPHWIGFLIALLLIGLSLNHFFIKRSIPIQPRPIYFGLMSFVTSFNSAIAGAGGPLMNPVYLGSGIVKEEMIATKAASTLVMQAFKLVAFASLGLLESVWLLGAVVGAGALLGNWLGKKCLARVSTATFRHAVYIVVGVSGVVMLLRSLAA